MTRFLSPALITVAFLVSFAGAEPASLQEEIDTLKAKNRAQASPEKLAAYARGIESVAESGIVERAIGEGDTAPDFTLVNATGAKVTLSEELEKGPVVLTWYRGGWCPYCNVQLAAYQKVLPQIEELGARLIALTPELPDKSLTTAEKNGLRFEVLSDVNLEVAARYGLVFRLTDEVADLYARFFDMKEYNGAESGKNALPLAATYVIDRDGTVAYAFLEADYTKRAEPRKILEVLDGLD